MSQRHTCISDMQLLLSDPYLQLRKDKENCVEKSGKCDEKCGAANVQRLKRGALISLESRQLTTEVYEIRALQRKQMRRKSEESNKAIGCK